MIARLALFSFATLLVAVTPTSAKEEAPPPRYTIDQLMAADSFGRLSLSPDNRKLLTTSNRTGIANLFVVPVAGGAPTQLTFSTRETIGAIGYFPTDERILYSSDQGGNELAHIYVRELDGRVRDVTPGDKHVARFVDWAQDGKSFYVQTNERDPRYFDLYEISASDYAKKLIFTNDKGYQIRAVSADRRYVAMSRIHDNANKRIYVYDRTAEKLTEITAGITPVSGEPEAFAAHGAMLYYTSDDGGEFAHLKRIDLATGKSETIFAPHWDVSGAGLSDDGRYLVVDVNEDARERPYLFNAATLKPVPLPDLAPDASTGLMVAHGAPFAIMSTSNGATPGDIFVTDFRNGKRRLLLSAQAPGVPPATLVPGKVIHFASYDGLQVPGILYLPRGAKPGDHLPAVIHVHGGPGDESSIGYRPLIQYEVNHGYAVFEINNRGSNGSGRTFYHLDDHRHGDADLDDVVAAKKMLVATGMVDGGKIAIQGQSYGGYMTLAGLAFRPDAFAAGIDLYGVANWPRLLRNTPSWWEDLRRLLFTEVGDPDKDAAYLEKISPVFHAENIRRPLLVLQGANDPRVLPIESRDIVAKVKANNVPVEYVEFPGEGHGFRKKANQIVAYTRVLEFLDKYVRGTPSEATAAQGVAPTTGHDKISPLGDFPLGK